MEIIILIVWMNFISLYFIFYLGLHSLEPSRLGLCLAQVNVDQFVVSVSISPTCRHLLLGLASSRALSVASRDHALPTLWAQVYQIPIKVFQAQRNNNPSATAVNAANAAGSNSVVVGDHSADHHQSSHQLLEKKPSIPPPQGSLLHVRDLSQTTDVGLTSLNCIRWIPTAGQGFVLGTNKGHLKVID
jgi:activator-of-BECN1-regulated-autophagy protein 1